MTADSNGRWASSLDEVEQLSLMHVTGHSTARYTLRAVTLDELFAEEAVPDHLIQVALLNMRPDGLVRQMAAHVAAGEQDTADELSRSNLELRDRLVLRAVVDPPLTAEFVRDKMDAYDKAMIASLCQRTSDVDADGKKVGADRLDSFRRVVAELAAAEADEARRKVLVELSEI